MARRRRRGGHDEEDHGGMERWLVTYADMLTLLLVLFIVLYSMSVVDTTKFVELRAGLAAVFDPGQNLVATQQGAVTASDNDGTDTDEAVTPNLMPPPVNGATNTILDQQKTTSVLQQADRAKQQQQAGDVQKEVDEFKQIEAAISKALQQQGLQGSARFSIDERGLVVTLITDGVVFAGNSAVLEPGGQKLLNVVVPPLKNFSNKIEVDGHTNQQNVSTAPYPSGWELSSARASSVVEYMIADQGIAASRLSAVGFSDQKPLIDPKDPRSITLNRRVDVVVLSNLTADERELLPGVANQPSK